MEKNNDAHVRVFLAVSVVRCEACMCVYYSVGCYVCVCVCSFLDVPESMCAEIPMLRSLAMCSGTASSDSCVCVCVYVCVCGCLCVYID